MQRILRDNGLSFVMFGLFLLFLMGQSVAGWKDYNDDQLAHGQQLLDYAQYLSTSHFLEGVFENWESEFLQMAAYVMLTVFLFQRGSAESKNPDQPEAVDQDPEPHRHGRQVPWPVRRGGIVLKLYNHSFHEKVGTG